MIRPRFPKIRDGEKGNGGAMELTDLDRLFQWQERALNAWEAHKRRGIVEGMTGTGKTMVAIKAIKRLQQAGVHASALIVVPSTALLDQWFANLKEQFPNEKFGRIGDGWHDSFARCADGALPLALVSTVHSAVPTVEQGLFAHCDGVQSRSFLIADECHRYINEDQLLYNRILRHDYDFTLGLSATIDAFEVPGLGQIIYTYGINQAVVDGVIPRFDVLNVGLSLSRDELTNYLELGDRIKDICKRIRDAHPDLNNLESEFYWRRIKLLARDDEDPLAKALLGCIFKRAAISYTAVAKLKLVPQIIELLVNKAQKKMLVFFERIWTAEMGQDDVVRRVAERVRQTVTGDGPEKNDDPIWCKVFHSELSDKQREAVLGEFKTIQASALLACRSLDEGLDVPAVDAAMLVASSQSPRQRLQRIGRTLRRGDGTKRPLILMLYVKGTSDRNVRISPDDEDFKDAATVYDAEPSNCLKKMMEILGMMPHLEAPASPKPHATTNALAMPPPNPEEKEWKLLFTSGRQPGQLDSIARKLAPKQLIKLSLEGGREVTGKWRMLYDGFLYLSEPTHQIASGRIERIYAVTGMIS